jgi:1-acyl-sn-glycerol-3-phosphate acyltransferase
MEIRRPVVNFLLKSIFNVLCKIDCKEFVEALANNKPLIVVFNHVNFLEVPILVTQSYPMNVSGIVKSETWNNPFFAFLFNTYKAVPIDRRGAFSESFKKTREAIENGFYMCIAPEGTRSKDGVLGKGKAGIVELAFEAGVPLLPIAHYGGEQIWKNIRRFRRTPFHFRAGRPFRIKFDDKRPDREEREVILSEVMGQIAKLLPEQKRGVYSEQAELDCKYLDFI